MKASDAGDARQQSISVLQKRYETLNTRKIQSETNLDHAHKELERLQAEAREKYGTDNVEDLKARLAQMKTDNENKRRDYQAELDRIESELTEIETRHQSATGSGS